MELSHPSSPQRRRPVVGDPEAAKTRTRQGWGTQSFEFIISHPSTKNVEGWGTQTLVFDDSQVPKCEGPGAPATDPIRFIISHPSTKNVEGWGTQTFSIFKSARRGGG